MELHDDDGRIKRLYNYMFDLLGLQLRIQSKYKDGGVTRRWGEKEMGGVNRKKNGTMINVPLTTWSINR